MTRARPPPNVQHFAIVLDHEIQSTPYIDYCQNPDGIPGDNGAQIDMGQGGGLGEAKQLALVLQTGALPVEFETAERTDVSATLGKDSLQEAKKAALVGLLVVALFLLLFYRFLGVIAVIGLGIYAAFLYAAILLFNVTLTLPGFAGLILTIGVAADANVVIFERIKEEVRAGKSVRAGIAAGYSKGFHTIIDANVVTAITALVLFAVATAQVKGFALMLLIGTVISLITAVGATRAMLGLLGGFAWFNNPRFMGAQGQQTAKWLQIDFMKRRNTWFAISGVIVLVGAAALGIRGLNLGIDFEGGTQLSFKTPVAHTTGDVRAVMADQGFGDAVIQGRGAAKDGDKYSSFQIRTEALESQQLTNVNRALEDSLQTTAPGATTVSSSFGRQIAKSAILAIVVSLLLVVIYIAIRFDFKFAAPVIIAMLHDVVICIGIYALARPGGDELDHRGDPHRARLLDLRHDHHLRPCPGEHPDHAPVVIRDDRERLAVGDDPPIAGDVLHHAASGRCALPVRRRHAQGLRVRTHRRHPLRCVLVHLHRRAGALDAEGARARVRTAEGRHHREVGPRSVGRGGGRCVDRRGVRGVR